MSDRVERKSGSLYTCPTCEKGVGAQVSVVLRVRRNARLKNGKLIPGSGTWVWVCGGCLSRGLITRVES